MKKQSFPPGPICIGLCIFVGIAAFSCLAVMVGSSESVEARTTNTVALPAMPPSGPVDFDFDYDGKSDIARWHPATAEFKVKNSLSGAYSTYTIGSSSAKAAPGNYDGDNYTDAAVFEAGTWTIKKSSAVPTATPTVETFGQAGDMPMAADYDGDGKTDLAVIRPSTNTWWVKRSLDGAIVPQSAGNTTDIPVPGDYDADGKTDIALYRPATGGWTINYSLNGTTGTATWGQAGTDVPVPADYDADGKTDLAIFRRSTGTWYVVKSNGGAWLVQAWGNYGDQPVPADYDGDNKADFSVWRPTTGVWHTIKSTTGVFDSQFLGQAGDTAVPSAYLKQVGGTVSAYDLAQARLSPKNATGGTDLYSRNFSWETSLVSLPGRAGLDAGFRISYNSLVWTKSGNEIYFDADTSNVSPGFRMGFPTIEPVYLDGKTGNFAYLMVTPSGGRVEFRQIAASSFYETADSSYIQLKAPTNSSPNDPVENLTLIVTGTDGTQMSYLWKGGAFRCSQIKDRNGNFITIAHNDYGQLVSMTDTLGRVVTVSYDEYGQPQHIKQAWGSGTNGSGALNNIDTNPHVWATLSYATKPISTSFNTSAVTVIGPPNTTAVKVLDKITYADGSSTRFVYNDYIQVYKVENYSAETTPTLLNYVSTSLQWPNANGTDCPVYSDTYNWAKDFNNNQAVLTTSTMEIGQSYTPPDGPVEPVTKVSVWTVGHPNNLLSKVFISESGWKEGLPIATEDWTQETGGWVRQRWSWTKYTQDEETLAYPNNPRVIESRVGDATNTKKTTIEYRMTGSPAVAEYGLVKKVEIGDLSAVLKRIETDYDLSQVYKDKRIIGLPSETKVTGKNDLTQNLELASSVTYLYDEGDFSQESNQIIPLPSTTHDNTNYGPTFVIGRGNLTSTTRHDVTGQTPAVTSKTRYDIGGSVVAKLDPLNRKVRIDYTDNFSDGGNSRNTFAYPKSITDAAGTSLGDALHSSFVKYRYDIGANVWAKSPAPQDQAQGKITEREYDDKGRLIKDKVVNYGGAYTRYEYPTNGIQSKVFSTAIDANSSGTGDTADETLTESWSDGAGRVRWTRTEHHSGSVSTWSASASEYDILGRSKKSTVPTEISVPNPDNPETWVPAGDDNRGVDGSGNPIWLWKSQEYDWMGRVTREVNTDGTDRLISYTSCGCAGGLVTTAQSEVIVDGYFEGTPNTLGRRTVKTHADLLGRTYKTEALWWNGNVYSTAVNEFNGRDQVVGTKQTDNTSTAQSFQEVTTTYDGHGRMKTRHYPVEGANTNTNWEYNADDSVQQVTDPRGAITSYTYNDARGLMTGLSYSVPQGSTIPATPSVSFDYDPAGNRISMTDGTGTTTYNYNQLSRISSEVRSFTGVTGSFTIAYAYHLGGGLNSIYDPGDAARTINYGYDRTGSLTSITANGSSVIQNRKIRAFGQVKQEDYAGGLNMRQQFDPRLRISQYDVRNSSQESQLRVDYTYNAAGQVDRANNVTFANFDRDYSYDHMGRLVSNQTKWTGGTDYAAYSTSVGYDVWNNLTNRATTIWGYTTITSSGYQNNRSTSSTQWNSYTATNAPPEYWQYDASGNATQTGPQTHKYDAAARKIEAVETSPAPPPGTYGRIELLIQQTYDGNGEIVKRFERETFNIGSPIQSTNYSLRSTVLGGAVLSQINQGVRGSDTIYEPSGIKAAFIAAPFTGSSMSTETDPFGTGIPIEPPPPSPPQDWLFPGAYGGGSANPFDGNGGCSWRGFPTDCSEVAYLLSIGDPRTMNDTCPSCGGGMGVWLNPEQIKLFERWGTRWGDSFDPFSWIGNTQLGNTREGQSFQTPTFVTLPRPQRQTRQGPKIDPKLPSHIPTLVSDLAKRKDCADILDKFAATLSKGKKDVLDVTEPGKTFVESVFDNMKSIVINDAVAGSGATTDGKNIWLRDYTKNNTNPLFDMTKPSMSPAAQRATWARYIIQELVHNFKRGGIFSDRAIDRAANAILSGMKPADAAKLQAAFAASGKGSNSGDLAHFLINQFCEYTQKEVDSGQPAD